MFAFINYTIYSLANSSDSFTDVYKTVDTHFQVFIYDSQQNSFPYFFKNTHVYKGLS